MLIDVDYVPMYIVDIINQISEHSMYTGSGGIIGIIKRMRRAKLSHLVEVEEEE